MGKLVGEGNALAHARIRKQAAWVEIASLFSTWSHAGDRDRWMDMREAL